MSPPFTPVGKVFVYHYQNAMMGAAFINAAGPNLNCSGVYDVKRNQYILKAYAAGASNFCPLYPGTGAVHVLFR
jgi:hypothetical protein